MLYVVTGAISAATRTEQYQLQPGDPFPEALASYLGDEAVRRLVVRGAIQPAVQEADAEPEPGAVQLPSSIATLSVSATMRWVAEHDDPPAAAAAALAHEQARPHPRRSLVTALQRTADPGDEAAA